MACFELNVTSFTLITPLPLPLDIHTRPKPLVRAVLDQECMSAGSADSSRRPERPHEALVRDWARSGCRLDCSHGGRELAARATAGQAISNGRLLLQEDLIAFGQLPFSATF